MSLRFWIVEFCYKAKRFYNNQTRTLNLGRVNLSP